MEATHERRKDIASVSVRFTNGIEAKFTVGQGIEAGFLRRSVNSSTEKRPSDRTEWDEIEVHLRSTSRPLRQG